MQGFKSAILAKLKNGTFEPVHEIWIFFGQKHSFEALWIWQYKNIHNLSQGPPNQGFMQEKVQKGDFLKMPLRELNFFVVLGSYESLEGLGH